MNAEYDRKLICFMLKYLATFPESMLAHTHGSIEEQARLLRCADNREAVGIHTETNTAATGMGELIDRLNFEAAALIATKGRVPESSDVSLLREAAAALAAQPAPAIVGASNRCPACKSNLERYCCACGWASVETAAMVEDKPRPMATAPKDGTIIRLLVKFTDYGFEDEPEGPTWTIGQNGADHHPEDDEWLFAGWNWEQDCFTQGEGEPVGWLPMLATPAQPAPVVGGAPFGDERWVAVKPEGAPYYGINTESGATVAGTASGLSEQDAKHICGLHNNELCEADDLIRDLGFDASRFRTEGGRINYYRLGAAIRFPEAYEGLALAARPGGDAVTQRALRQQKAAREGVCLWSQQDDGYDTYSTGCGQEFTVNDCTDGNVKLPYCPFCAMDLESRAWAADDDDAAHPAQAGGEAAP